MNLITYGSFYKYSFIFAEQIHSPLSKLHSNTARRICNLLFTQASKTPLCDEHLKNFSENLPKTQNYIYLRHEISIKKMQIARFCVKNTKIGSAWDGAACKNRLTLTYKGSRIHM